MIFRYHLSFKLLINTAVVIFFVKCETVSLIDKLCLCDYRCIWFSRYCQNHSGSHQHNLSDAEALFYIFGNFLAVLPKIQSQRFDGLHSIVSFRILFEQHSHKHSRFFFFHLSLFPCEPAALLRHIKNLVYFLTEKNVTITEITHFCTFSSEEYCNFLEFF